jgi:hypothetical protein
MSEREIFEHEGSTTRRLDRVESDVAALTTAVVKVESGLQNVSAVLGRIESSIVERDQREERVRLAKEPNPLAVGVAIFSVIVSLIGGAWTIGGQLSRLDARDLQRDAQLERMDRRTERLEDRLHREAEKP